MRAKNDILNEDNLEKEAPLLANIPKSNSFTVPEGYFDELPSAIMEKCRQSIAMPETGNKIFWLFRPQWMIALFAGIVALAVFMRNTTTASFETLAAKTSDSAIYQNLQANIEYVDVTALEEAVQNDNVTAVPLRSDSTGNQQEIVNYLMNHNIDASDIEDEL